MLQRIHEWLSQNNREWWSKLTDGLLPVLIMILLWQTISLAMYAITATFNTPGLLVFVLGLLAISMFSLQQSIVQRHSETIRAWYGMVGGFLAWSVAEGCAQLGVPILPNIAGVLMFIMVALIVRLLWRSVFPLGVRFFSLTLLLNWSAYIFLNVQEWLASRSPIFALSLRVTGIIALLTALLTVFWILFQTNRRFQRVSGALAVWFLLTVVFYTFRTAFF